MSKTVEYPARKDQNGNLVRFRKAWDNGGKSIDRYTITFAVYNEHTGKWDIFSQGWNTDAPKEDHAYQKIYCLCMNNAPFSPQGVCQSSTCIEGPHLGKRIKYSQLPEVVQRYIIHYLQT